VKGRRLANISSGFWVNLLNPKVIIFFMTFLPQFVSAGDPAVTHKLLFPRLFFILIGMPVNAAVVFAADWLAGWLQSNKKVLRGMDYTFAGVFSSSRRRSCSRRRADPSFGSADQQRIIVERLPRILRNIAIRSSTCSVLRLSPLTSSTISPPCSMMVRWP
jgi:hypothetical protein